MTFEIKPSSAAGIQGTVTKGPRGKMNGTSEPTVHSVEAELRALSAGLRDISETQRQHTQGITEVTDGPCFFPWLF